MARNRRRQEDSYQSYNPEYEAQGNGKMKKLPRVSTGLLALEIVLLLIATICMCLVVVAPIKKDGFTYYLYSLDIEIKILIDKITDNFMFGVWGYCTSGVQNKFGIIKSHITDATCAPVWETIDVPKVSTKYKRLIAAGLSILSAIHLIAAIATLFSFIFFCITKGKAKSGSPKYPNWLRRTWTSMIVTLCLSLFACIVDFTTIITAKSLAKEKGKDMATLQFGVGIWILLGGTVTIVIASILLFSTGCCCGKRTRSTQGDYTEGGIPLEDRRHRHRNEEAYPDSPQSVYSSDGQDVKRREGRERWDNIDL